MTLDRSHRISGIFLNLIDSAPGYSGSAVCVRKQIEKQPDTGSHRDAVFAFGVSTKPSPDRCPPLRGLPCPIGYEPLYAFLWVIENCGY